jgi:adenylate cyclase
MSAWLALAVAAAVAVGLGAALWKSRRRSTALEQALTRATHNLEHLETAFARFAPENVVDRLAAGAREIRPERREVTVMFADLRGFTPLSERIDPAVIVPVLNDYFRRMSRVISEHHGHVSRIMGDGLMALFGALEPNAWHTPDAARAALAMREELRRYNDELQARALPALAFGVGLHRGEVVAAVVGSDHMMEFTVMGDVVNVAARIEALTRRLDADVLVTAAVRERLDERFKVREQPPSTVKGKSEPIVTWAIDAFEG